jgi:hypothetical protein
VSDIDGGMPALDLWPTFCEFWSAHAGLPAVEQVTAWLRTLERICPEVYQRYAASMVTDGVDWGEDLLRRHWPSLSRHLPRMAETHDRALTIFSPMGRRAREALDTDLRAMLVIVPVGYGGWATTYQGQPACDLGLDTIVELGWDEPETLKCDPYGRAGDAAPSPARGRCGKALIAVADDGRYVNAYRAMQQRHSAAVFVNASTRFNGRRQWRKESGAHRQARAVNGTMERPDRRQACGASPPCPIVI